MTGIILAGGKSSRMGTDKGLMRLNGKPMIQHVIDPMAKICPRILIVTSDPMYGMFGFELVKDEQPDFGPVMGVLSGLRRSTTDLNLVMSCDVPFVSLDLMKQLVLRSVDCNAVVASSERGVHPLIGVYNKTSVPAFEHAVSQREHRLRNVLKQLKVEELPLSDTMADQLRNVNSKADLQT